MNNILLKSTLPTIGALLGALLVVSTLRTFVGMMLGSGIYGAVPLAIVVGVVGVVGGLMLANYSLNALFKVFNNSNEKEQTNEDA